MLLFPSWIPAELKLFYYASYPLLKISRQTDWFALQVTGHWTRKPNQFRKWLTRKHIVHY